MPWRLQAYVLLHRLLAPSDSLPRLPPLRRTHTDRVSPGKKGTFSRWSSFPRAPPLLPLLHSCFTLNSVYELSPPRFRPSPNTTFFIAVLSGLWFLPSYDVEQSTFIALQVGDTVPPEFRPLPATSSRRRVRYLPLFVAFPRTPGTYVTLAACSWERPLFRSLFFHPQAVKISLNRIIPDRSLWTEGFKASRYA